jgi:predicted aconitase with swiveling domain
VTLDGEALVAGEAAGRILRIDDAISFWGGVDPKTARVSDPRHARHGESLTGRVVAIARLRGSSSSSAVLLELIHAGIGPAAIVLRETDAILALGALVAREMGYGTLPMVRVGDRHFTLLLEGDHAHVKGPRVTVAGGSVA